MSCSVELLIGDNRKQPDRSARTWRALIERRVDIERFVQSTDAPSLTIHQLHVQLVKLRDENIVKLTLRDACIYLKPATMLFIFELEHCVEHVYYTLYQSTTTVT
jgi:hypothetical protein